MLRLLVQVARSGSFSAAGRALGLSAPSVFRYMNQLEDEIGVTLFRRSSRKISLTEAGQSVLGQASAIVRDIDELKVNISGADAALAGVLRIHTRVATGNELVVPVVARFRQLHKDIDLQLIISDRKIDLVDDNIDASITTDPLNESKILSEEVVSCKYVLCASPEYLQRAGVPSEPAQLQQHECITFHHGDDPPRYRFRRKAIVEVVAPRSVVHTNNAGAIISLALDGGGIVMLPQWLLANDLRAGRLIRILEGYEYCSTISGEFQRTVLVLYLKSRAEYPALRTFLAFLTSALRQRARSGWR